MIKPKSKGRFGNVKREKIDGYNFASKREAARYMELKLLVHAGAISNLAVQPPIPITIGGVKVLSISDRYPNGRHVRYVADFKYTEKGVEVWEDVKMSKHRTEIYKLKRALVLAMGIAIRETT